MSRALPRRRSWVRAARRWSFTFAALVAAVLASALPASASAQDGAPATIVSLTFDDGWETQRAAARLLTRYGLTGTFYVNSGSLDSDKRLSTAQVHELVEAGHEIGGHTLDHMPLTAIDAAETMRQICDDRTALARILGDAPRSFAYPYGAYGARVKRAVEECGYSSGRTVGGIRSDDCPGCPPSERIQPADPFAIRTGLSLVAGTTPAGAIAQVKGALARGGWVTFVFHDVCDGCSPSGVPTDAFVELIEYLRGQQRAGALRVLPVGDVVERRGRPPVAGPADTRAEAQLVNGSLEQPAADAGPGVVSGPGADVTSEAGEFDEATRCWIRSGYGANRGVWRRVSPGRTGPWAEAIEMVDHRSGDMKLITRMDEGSCAVPVDDRARYRLRMWYRGSATPHLVAFYKTASGRWRFLGRSAAEPASSGWREASWTTPELPDGAQRLSFGLQVASVGTLTVDDLSMARADEGLPASAVVLVIGVGALALIATVLVLARRSRSRRRAAG